MRDAELAVVRVEVELTIGYCRKRRTAWIRATGHALGDMSEYHDLPLRFAAHFILLSSN